MKKTIYMITVFMLISFSIYAQGHHKERIQSWRVAFITEKLELTPEEAQQFWPVYNQYQKELEGLREKKKEGLADVKDNFRGMTDKEVEAAMTEQLELEQDELNLKKKYHNEFKKVLPVKKVARLYAAERQFKVLLLQKISEKRRE